MILLQSLCDVITNKGFNHQTQILTKGGVYIATKSQRSWWCTYYYVYSDIPYVEAIRINAKFFRRLDGVILIGADYNESMYNFLQEKDASLVCRIYESLKGLDLGERDIKTLTIEVTRLLILSGRHHDNEYILQILIRVFRNILNDSSYNEQYLQKIVDAIRTPDSKR